MYQTDNDGAMGSEYGVEYGIVPADGHSLGGHVLSW